jgi:mRNA-degrading endonuclease YafQ of YafQ-DinJ toxin-antitoxin module
MRRPSYTRQFEKDLQRMLKRGKDTEKLKLAVTVLIEEEPLCSGSLVPSIGPPC